MRVCTQVPRPKQTIPVTNLNMIMQLCSLLDVTIEDHPRMSDPQILEAVFIFCVLWSIGASIVQVRAWGVLHTHTHTHTHIGLMAASHRLWPLHAARGHLYRVWLGEKGLTRCVCVCVCVRVSSQRPDCPDRDRFDAFIKRLANMGSVDGERVSATQLPHKSLYEYCFDTMEGVWKAWKVHVTDYDPPEDGQFSKILIPTVDVVRYV